MACDHVSVCWGQKARVPARRNTSYRRRHCLAGFLAVQGNIELFVTRAPAGSLLQGTSGLAAPVARRT